MSTATYLVTITPHWIITKQTCLGKTTCFRRYCRQTL